MRAPARTRRARISTGPTTPRRSSLNTFAGLRHRCQTIATIRGVRVVNDSKATNADATAKALGSFERIRWIAGGRPKEGGIEPLRPLFGRVVKTYLIGEAAEEFAASLGETPHEICGTLDVAVTAALAEAEEGETVLLAPACASFDMFKSYEHRGEVFSGCVEKLHCALAQPVHRPVE